MSVHIHIAKTAPTNFKCKIKWAKLELGEIATPFVSPNHASELLKCKYYYQQIIGEFVPYIYADNNIYIAAKIDGSMRCVPTMKFKNKIFNNVQGNPNNPRGVAMVSYVGGIHTGFTFTYFLNGNEGNDIRYITILATKENHGCMNNAYLIIGIDNPLCLEAEIY